MNANLNHARIFATLSRDGGAYDIYLNYSNRPRYLMSYAGDEKVRRKLSRGMSYKKLQRNVKKEKDNVDLVRLTKTINNVVYI